MAYVFLYFSGLAFLWWCYRVGWLEALKTLLSILIPSLLIILFNLKAGRVIFRSPVLGLISVLPTAVIIYKGSQPLVTRLNSYIDRIQNSTVDIQDIVDTEVISKEDD